MPPSDPQAITFLTQSTLGAAWLFPSASNYTFLVELCLEGRRGYGVYKPGAGEVALWDFAAGTLYRREYAAYLLSQWLGWGFVPPTVQREGEVGFGTFQLYVPPVAQSNYFTLREAYEDEVLCMAVFDLVANNADRKAGHCFLGQTGGVWGVDHGLTFHAAPKLRTVIWDFAGRSIPGALLEDLGRLLTQLETPGAEATAVLEELLALQEVDALKHRLEGVLQEPLLPTPYSRRHYPWPLV